MATKLPACLGMSVYGWDGTGCIMTHNFRYCDMNDYPCVIYDHECTGESTGDVKDVNFTHWVEDAFSVIDVLTEV